MKGYDGIFLLSYLIEKAMVPQTIIFKGTKIMTMTIANQLNIKVIDSFNHLPMSLSKLPQSFGLTELKKGYFPHLFNTLENHNYVGPYPPTKFYSPEFMSAENRTKFLK